MVRVGVCAADRGRELVAAVTERRRQEVQAVVARPPREAREQLVATPLALADVAGDAPEQEWQPGWWNSDG